MKKFQLNNPEIFTTNTHNSISKQAQNQSQSNDVDTDNNPTDNFSYNNTEAQTEDDNTDHIKPTEYGQCFTPAMIAQIHLANILSHHNSNLKLYDELEKIYCTNLY